ncbi:MAG: 4Fe-4S binding protein [Spirochaetota bacterium]
MFYYSGFKEKENPQLEPEILRRVIPQADFFSEKKGDPPFYEAYTEEDGNVKKVGICFLTTEVFPEERGYGGPIGVLVGLDMRGVITGIHIVFHRETESYVRPMYEPWFTDQFRGKGVWDALTPGKDIQGITRATITSGAVARVVRRSARTMASRYLGVELPEEAEEKLFIPWIDVSIISALFIIASIGLVTGKRVFLWIGLGGGFAWLGVIKVSPLSTVHFINLLMGNIPSKSQGILLYVLIGASVVTALILGRVYCRGVCPFGALQDFMHIVSPLSSLVKIRFMSESSIGKMGNMRFVVLWGIVAGAFLIGDSKVAAVEPFVFLFNMRGSVFAWALIGVVLFWGLFYRRFWCRFFCPVGAALQLLTILSPVRIWRLKDEDSFRI